MDGVLCCGWVLWMDGVGGRMDEGGVGESVQSARQSVN
jgi:hypothetical protein